MHIHIHMYMCVGDHFPGFQTTASWIVSINTFNSPLNGLLMVYALGADIAMPPVVSIISVVQCSVV